LRPVARVTRRNGAAVGDRHASAVNRHPPPPRRRSFGAAFGPPRREHNDANVIAMGARLIGIAMAKECLDAFLNTEFGGDRHRRRVEKLSNPSFAKEIA
jgi:ribose 5-phosphate isomerase B